MSPKASFKLTLVNHLDPLKSVTKGEAARPCCIVARLRVLHCGKDCTKQQCFLCSFTTVAEGISAQLFV